MYVGIHTCSLVLALNRLAMLAGVYKLYLRNLTTSTTTATVRMIRTATPAIAAPAASPTDEELLSMESEKIVYVP